MSHDVEPKNIAEPQGGTEVVSSNFFLSDEDNVEILEGTPAEIEKQEKAQNLYPMVGCDGQPLHMTYGMMDAINFFIEFNGNKARVLREWKKKYGGNITQNRLDKWLTYPRVHRYIQKRITDMGYTNGMTRERWMREAIEFRDGVRKLDKQTGFMHKLIGEACGYLETPEQKSGITVNQQINFVQADGTP